MRRTRLLGLLDALTAGLAVTMVTVIATGGWGPLRRAEDLLVALATVVAVRSLVAPVALPAVRPRTAVAAGTIVYGIVMSFIVLSRHAALQTHALDLGYYVQVVWGIATGQGPYVTLPPMHAWGDHLSPILYVFGPFQWMWPGATVLLVAQTWILAMGAFAVFGFAQRRLPPRAAAAFALLYLLNPSLHGINVRDIHPQAFAIPLLIGAALAFETQRYGACVMALMAVAACREDAALAVLGFGAWIAVARSRWTVGMALGIASVFLLLVDLHYVMPYFRGAPYPHLHRYAYLGSSLGEILLNAVVRPWQWLGALLSARKALYLLAMLGPLAFVPLLAPRALVGALPGLAMNLLSTDPILFNYRSQYQSFVLPFLVLAAVEGYRGLTTAPLSERGFSSRWSAQSVLAVAFFLSVVLTARTVNDLTVTRWRLGQYQRAAYTMMAQIPAGASVSANERLVAHLATRREVYVFPYRVGRSEYVLDRHDARMSPPMDDYEQLTMRDVWVLWHRR